MTFQFRSEDEYRDALLASVQSGRRSEFVRPKTRQYHAIRDLMQDGRERTVADIQRDLGLGIDKVYHALGSLRADGVIEMVGRVCGICIYGVVSA